MKYLTPQNIFGFLSLIGMITFWIYTQNSLPKRVDNHETRILTLEKDNIEFKAKQDLMLQAIYETRTDIKQIMRDIKR